MNVVKTLVQFVMFFFHEKSLNLITLKCLLEA